MYQIKINGYIETDKAEEVVEAFKKVLTQNNATLYGDIKVFKLPDYIDFQKIEPENGNKENDNIKGRDTNTTV